jgi:hypothetical protein
MWILSILPEAAIHIIFGLGVLGTIAGFVLGFIPFVKAYQFAIQICSIVVLVVGVYLEGGLSDYKEWEFKVKELEVKVAEAKVESEKVNTKIVEKIVTQKQIIREQGKTITEYVDREIVKYDTKYLPGAICEIPQEVIKAHNMAASGKKLEDIEIKSNTPIPTDAINKAAMRSEKVYK